MDLSFAAAERRGRFRRIGTANPAGHEYARSVDIVCCEEIESGVEA
jgi:hypothetical protein